MTGDISVYVNSVSLQVPVTWQEYDPQYYTSMMISKLKYTYPDVQMISVDGVVISDNSSISKNKLAYDRLFHSETKKKGMRTAIFIFLHSKVKNPLHKWKVTYLYSSKK